MRKLSPKWPVRMTIVAFLSPMLYVFFRIPPIFHVFFGEVEKPPIISTTELAEKVVGAVGITTIIWLIYGVSCLCARTWVNCEKCKFSDVTQDSKEMKCQLNGYNYPITYSCKKSRPKK